MNNQTHLRQRESLNRAIVPGVVVLLRRSDYHMKIAVKFPTGSIFDVTRLVAQAFELHVDSDGIRATTETNELAMIEALANCCTHLYNVRLI